MKNKETVKGEFPGVKITEDKHGRFFAQYVNPSDLAVNGIGQFGNTAFEAKINLFALIRTVRRRMNLTVVNIES